MTSTLLDSARPDLAFRRRSWRRPYRVLNALCDDGKRRNVTLTTELNGTNSARGFVSAKGKTVTGRVYAFGDDWRFAIDLGGKNAYVMAEYAVLVP